ncbi:MAG: glycosyltransferase [Planctomycetaceae bacterium]
MGTSFGGLRVVHAANYALHKDAAAYFNCDLKFHQGLVQNGCLVYPFSVNDRARMLSFLCSRKHGAAAANRALVTTCRQMQPDALIIGHSQAVTRKTLEQIRDVVPRIRIGYWYVDPLWMQAETAHLHQRADLFDAICCTTGGDLLKQFARPGTPAAFIPNPVEQGVERLRAFETPQPSYDVTFIGRDKYAPERRATLERLQRELRDLKLGFFGCLGRPLVFGAEKDAILASSRIGLNLNRRNDVELYSSDRIAQLTGNGLLAAIETGAGFEELYAADEALFYDDIDALVVRIRELVSDASQLRELARASWLRAHRDYSAQKVAEYLLNLTFRRAEACEAPWSRHIHWHPADRSTRLQLTQRRSAA